MAKHRGNVFTREKKLKRGKVIKVGFYDAKNDQMLSVEPWEASKADANVSAVHLAALYQSGRHRLPSPLWCLWDGDDLASVYFLDKGDPDQSVLDKALLLMV